jgi:hypothetical protein
MMTMRDMISSYTPELARRRCELNAVRAAMSSSI